MERMLPLSQLMNENANARTNYKRFNDRGRSSGAAGILKCLQFNPSFEIVMADANPDAVGRWLHAEFETISFANEKNFIETLLSICQRRTYMLFCHW